MRQYSLKDFESKYAVNRPDSEYAACIEKKIKVAVHWIDDNWNSPVYLKIVDGSLYFRRPVSTGVEITEQLIGARAQRIVDLYNREKVQDSLKVLG